MVERPLLLRVAAIQTNSNYLDKEGNLARVRPLIEEAANKGAQLVLLPEMIAGYAYSSEIIWGSAELIPSGVTSQFISSEAKRLQIHLGTTILEAKGEHFYNTFVLAGNAPHSCFRASYPVYTHTVLLRLRNITVYTLSQVHQAKF